MTDRTRDGESSPPDAAEARRMEAVGRLAAGVAHDFNNVLAAIRGYGQIALRSLDDLLAAEGEETHETVHANRAALERLRADVGAIEDGTQRAAALTRRLSALTRPTGGEPARIELDAVAAAAYDLATRLLPPSLAVALVPPPGPVMALADEAALLQIVLELLLDLRDALGGAGRIEIGTAYAGAGDARATIVLRHSAPSGRVPGARARRLAVELLGPSGGELLADGREGGEGRDAVIVLSLRAAPAQGGALPAATDSPESVAGGATVLLVEDDDAVRRIARTVLERLGYRVVPAGDGREALRMAELLASDDVVPDVLVTDVTMPAMNGPELAAEMRRRAPEIGVLFMSGMGEPAAAGAAPAGARVDFLEKPFTLDDLASRVAGLLRRAS